MKRLVRSAPSVRLLSTLSLAAALLGAGAARSATTFDYSIAFDPSKMKCGYFLKAGLCAQAQAITPINAAVGDTIHVSATSNTPLKVPGSAVSNGFFVDAYDKTATYGLGGPGPVHATSVIVPTGLVTSPGAPAPYPYADASRSYEYLATLSYFGTNGVPNNGFSVSGLDATMHVIAPDPYPTIGVAFGWYWTTTDVPDALSNFVGGPEDAPVILPAGLIGELTGSIGDPGGPSSQFYNFHWSGGFFQTLASIDGAAADSEFTFKLRNGDGSYLKTLSLDGTSGYSQLFGDYLAAGDYTIGFKTGISADPGFTLKFLTPVGVDAVPEPSVWAMLIAGFGFVGAQFRFRRRTPSPG